MRYFYSLFTLNKIVNHQALCFLHPFLVQLSQRTSYKLYNFQTVLCYKIIYELKLKILLKNNVDIFKLKHTQEEKKKKLHTLSNKTIRWIRLSKRKTTLLITKWWLISLVANKSSRRFGTSTLAIKTMSTAMRVQNFYHPKASWGKISRLLLYIMYLSNPSPSRGRLFSEMHP